MLPQAFHAINSGKIAVDRSARLYHLLMAEWQNLLASFIAGL
jgi:hypothetical protein